jgi:hypothetical protein
MAVPFVAAWSSTVATDATGSEADSTTGAKAREESMNKATNDLRILRLHKTWADKYTMLWQLFILLLFGGIYFLFEQSGIDAMERAAAFVLLAAMVLAAAIWQAVGLGVARIHMLLNGVDLEQRTKPDAPSRRDQA